MSEKWEIGAYVEFESGLAGRVTPAVVVDNDIHGAADHCVVSVWSNGLTNFEILPSSALLPRGAHNRIWVDGCNHTVPISVVEERCHVCRGQATHKIGDESGPANFHNLTNWLCCSCMGGVGLRCGLYPDH